MHNRFIFAHSRYDITNRDICRIFCFDCNCSQIAIANTCTMENRIAAVKCKITSKKMLAM